MNTVNGTTYPKDTPQKVIDVLERYRHRDRRVRLFLGDRETGKDWGEKNDVTGYIRRSSGSVKVPILAHNYRSLGGGAILTDCIVKIMDTTSKRILYQHPTYHQPVYTVMKVDLVTLGYTATVYADNQSVANFKTRQSADRWIRFMVGTRMSK